MLEIFLTVLGMLLFVKFLRWVFKSSKKKTKALPEFKKCPACAEPIRYEAIKCRHCYESLVPQERPR